jgi:actin-related protein
MKPTEKRNTVVIDPGSDTLKAGFAGDDYPKLVCRDLIFKVCKITVYSTLTSSDE